MTTWTADSLPYAAIVMLGMFILAWNTVEAVENVAAAVRDVRAWWERRRRQRIIDGYQVGLRVGRPPAA